MRTWKTYYMEQDGIRVEGYASKAEARKAWLATRDSFAKCAAEDRPWIFCYQGCVLVVAPTPGGWEYALLNAAERTGKCFASCFFNAPHQTAAIASAIGALAQYVWTRSVEDDSEFFDHLVKLARLYPHEAVQERSDFLTVAAHWRKHPLAA